MEEFKSWVHDMCLIDVKLIGIKYNWSRGNSYSKLDRMLANLEQGMKFPNMKLKALPSKNSDHTPPVL